jgi:hypothetical protein
MGAQMAMKKAEMEAERLQYREAIRRAQAAEQRGMYREVVQEAIAAWPYVDGMVLHERRYEGNEVAAIAAIDLVLRFAPLLLDAQPLDELEQLLASYKRVLKDAYVALAEKLARARGRIAENHRLWSYLERNPGVEQEDLRQALGGEQERWRTTAEAWARMGLLERTRSGRTYRLTLSTRMGQIVRGKCPACGHVDEAPKSMFLEEVMCPRCRDRVSFVLLTAEPAAAV